MIELLQGVFLKLKQQNIFHTRDQSYCTTAPYIL